MAVAAVVMALVAAGPYITFSRSRVPLDPAFPLHIVVLSLHALLAGLALLLGPLQFLGRLRTRFPKAHRVIGSIYLAAVFLGSLMAFGSALASRSGFTPQVGFLLLDVVWVYTAVKALVAVKRRQYEWHRIWMIRNYALTFAAVTLRVNLFVIPIAASLTGVRLEFRDIYNVSAWAALIVNVVVVEWFIVQPLMQPKPLPLSGLPLTPAPNKNPVLNKDKDKFDAVTAVVQA